MRQPRISDAGTAHARVRRCALGKSEMKMVMKSALAAIAFSVLGAGVALAADCCCKEMDCKMPCCEKKAEAPKAPAPDHQH